MFIPSHLQYFYKCNPTTKRYIFVLQKLVELLCVVFNNKVEGFVALVY